MLDGRAINGHFWVFFGALSNVEYSIGVTDTETGQTRTYTNPLGEFASVGDTEALLADPPDLVTVSYYPEDRERIFRRFTQAASEKPRRRGFGRRVPRTRRDSGHRSVPRTTGQ